MDTKKAFLHLLETKWDDLPEDKYLWKHRAEHEKISLEKMSEILKKYGYSMTQKEEWGKTERVSN